MIMTNYLETGDKLMEEKVSIIVPTYNAESYIGRCLEAIINQTYRNIEVIVINDCSTDNSIEIIKSYQEQLHDFHVVNLEENKGVSNARNIGINLASGKYIMFCDSDDWYEENAVEILINEAKNNEADFVMANQCIVKENTKIKVNNRKYFKDKNITRAEIVAYMTFSSSAKLIKRNLFLDNNILYPIDIKRCEEFTVIPVIAYLANNPIVIDDVIYNYYQRSNSASNSRAIDTEFFHITFERFIEKIDKETYRQEIEFRAINHLLYGELLVMLKSGASRREMIDKINCFKKEHKNFLKNVYLKRYNKAKLVFIVLLKYKMLFLANIYAKLHEKLTTKTK